MIKAKSTVISELIKYLRGNRLLVNKLPKISNFKPTTTQNQFFVEINGIEYLLILHAHKFGDRNSSFINLRNLNRPQGKQSVLQLSIDNSNFKINGRHFEVVMNRSITIGTKQNGLKEEYYSLLKERGFSTDNIVFKGDFFLPKFDLIVKDLFFWLKIASEAKIFLNPSTGQTSKMLVKWKETLN